MSMMRSFFFRFLTSCALIIALAASGFAHASPRMAFSADLLAYVAAGGSLDDLCGTAGEQDGARTQKCEACRLVGVAILPRDCHGIPVRLSDQTFKLSFVAKRLHQTRPLDPSRLTRAPPQT